MNKIITGLELQKPLEQRVKELESDLLVMRQLMSEIITGVVILSCCPAEEMQRDFAKIEEIIKLEQLSSIDVNNLPESLGSKFSRETIVLFCLTSFQKMLSAIYDPVIKQVSSIQ